MENANIQTNNIEGKAYNGCLETLLVWWIIGGFLALIWNIILLFTEPYDTEGYIAISVLTASDVIALYGLFQLKRYKAIGFYLCIGTSILDLIIANIWPQYLLASNPQMRSIFSIVLLVVLLLLKNNGKSGFQTIGIVKDKSTVPNQSKEIESLVSNDNEPLINPTSEESIPNLNDKNDSASIESQQTDEVAQYAACTVTSSNNVIVSVNPIKDLSEPILESIEDIRETSPIQPQITPTLSVQEIIKEAEEPSRILIDPEIEKNESIEATKNDVETQSEQTQDDNNKESAIEDTESLDNTPSCSTDKSDRLDRIPPKTNYKTKLGKTLWAIIPLVVIIIVSLFYFCLPKESSDEKYERFKTLYDQKKYEESLPIIQELLKEDYTPAYREYGNMLLNGYGVQMDKTKAIETLEIAASRNDLKSILNLAKYYKKQKEWSNCLKYYIQAENLGDTDNYNTMAWIYIEDKNPSFSIDHALKYANKALDKGDKEALFTLGNIYSHDKKKDYDMAFYWWNKGTIDGSNNCKQHCWDNIGWVYLYGQGCKIDYSKAYDAFSNALRIEPKDSYALYHIGEMYYYGEYVKEDDDMALSYLKRASDLGNEDAQKLYAEIMRDRKKI